MLAVFCGGFARIFFKHFHKVNVVCKADRVGDFFDAKACGFEQPAGFADADFHEIVFDRTVICFFKNPTQVRVADIKMLADFGDRKVNLIIAVFNIFSSDALSQFSAKVKTHEILLDVVMASNPEAEWESQIAAIKNDAAVIEKELNEALK